MRQVLSEAPGHVLGEGAPQPINKDCARPNHAPKSLGLHSSGDLLGHGQLATAAHETHPAGKSSAEHHRMPARFPLLDNDGWYSGRYAGYQLG